MFLLRLPRLADVACLSPILLVASICSHPSPATLHIQFSNKVMLAAAFSTEISGHAAGEGRSLDLTNFQRNLANLKLEIEF